MGAAPSQIKTSSLFASEIEEDAARQPVNARREEEEEYEEDEEESEGEDGDEEEEEEEDGEDEDEDEEGEEDEEEDDEEWEEEEEEEEEEDDDEEEDEEDEEWEEEAAAGEDNADDADELEPVEAAAASRAENDDTGDEVSDEADDLDESAAEDEEETEEAAAEWEEADDDTVDDEAIVDEAEDALEEDDEVDSEEFAAAGAATAAGSATIARGRKRSGSAPRRRGPTPLFAFDAGWLFLAAGLTLVGATVIIPAQQDLAMVEWQRDRAVAIEAHRLERLDRYGSFLHALRRGDESVVLSLAASQLNKTSIDRVPLYQPADPAETSASVFPALEPDELKIPDHPTQTSMLGRLTNSSTARLWMMAGGLLCIFAGILPTGRGG